MQKTMKRISVEKCTSHTLVDGKVYRTEKNATAVKRERICPICDRHYWTMEYSTARIDHANGIQAGQLQKALDDGRIYRQMLENAAVAISRYMEVLAEIQALE